MLVKPKLFLLLGKLSFEYKLCGSRINRKDTVKDLGVFLDSKLYSLPTIRLYILASFEVTGSYFYYNLFLFIF
jgi:hypothetical protein